MRVGQGFDVHAFAADRPLILGGIHIPHDLGLAGHSDADVLIHAIIDALLGAAGLGDIGEHFPDNDPRYAGADSGVLLQHVMGLLLQRGYQLVNLDACVIAQQPRLSPYKAAMRERLAQLLEAPLDAVNIKATTTEKLGFTGRGEGIAAQAVVMIDKENT
jgi:2-C-methyl-D-erythritol 2,4-cyclodiphosphate synthase